jgi:hypothetical protein
MWEYCNLFDELANKNAMCKAGNLSGTRWIEISECMRIKVSKWWFLLKVFFGIFLCAWKIEKWKQMKCKCLENSSTLKAAII